MNTSFAPPQLRDRQLPVVLTVTTLAMLALVVGASIITSGGPVLGTPMPVLVGVCALAAFCAERGSWRARSPLVKNAAPAIYVFAALLLPAPRTLLIAVTAVIATYLTARGAAVYARVAATAHSAIVVGMSTLVVRATLGHEPLLGSVITTTLHHRRDVRSAASAAPFGGSSPLIHVVDLWGLLALIVTYYALDTLLLAATAVLLDRSAPPAVWRRLHGGSFLPELGVLALGVLAAELYSVSVPLALIAVPIGAGLHGGLAAITKRRMEEGEMRSLREDRIALREHAVAADANSQEVEARLEAVLTSVRTIAGNEDLANVTRTLADVAPRLTPFRACTVYLYDAREGTFVAQACTDKVMHNDDMSRSEAEVLMTENHLLAYSYYIPQTRVAGFEPQAWHSGDRLLVPLLLKRGDVIGFFRLDAPQAGYVPQARDLSSLETVAFLAASVIARLRQTDEVLHLAATDGLTGLLNRRTFEHQLHEQMAYAERRIRPMALMMIDLDDFGSINNTYGHQIGDEALRLVSGVIRQQLRASDLGGRYGGDEFAVILPGLDAFHAAEIAERLRVALVDATTRAAAGGSMPLIHTSIGVAAFPDNGIDPAGLMKSADDALYQSKRLGKNRVSLCNAA